MRTEPKSNNNENYLTSKQGSLIPLEKNLTNETFYFLFVLYENMSKTHSLVQNLRLF